MLRPVDMDGDSSDEERQQGEPGGRRGRGAARGGAGSRFSNAQVDEF